MSVRARSVSPDQKTSKRLKADPDPHPELRHPPSATDLWSDTNNASELEFGRRETYRLTPAAMVTAAQVERDTRLRVFNLIDAALQHRFPAVLVLMLVEYWMTPRPFWDVTEYALDIAGLNLDPLPKQVPSFTTRLPPEFPSDAPVSHVVTRHWRRSLAWNWESTIPSTRKLMPGEAVRIRIDAANTSLSGVHSLKSVRIGVMSPEWHHDANWDFHQTHSHNDLPSRALTREYAGLGFTKKHPVVVGGRLSSARKPWPPSGFDMGTYEWNVFPTSDDHAGYRLVTVDLHHIATKRPVKETEFLESRMSEVYCTVRFEHTDKPPVTARTLLSVRDRQQPQHVTPFVSFVYSAHTAPVGYTFHIDSLDS